MPAMVIAQGGERSLTIYNIHTKETVTAVFKRGNKYDAAGLEKLGQITRDHRRDEATKMDPELFDLLWEMHRELGSREPIHLISGFRSRATNEMLRKTSGGQASESRHILGKAADVHFPDVPIKKLRYSALVQEKGGVGYYPTSAIPFVHVDTDRVRSWPRLPRMELALLFPSGSSKHSPADGGPITMEDVRTAQARHRDLATQMASFHGERRGIKAPVAVARAEPHPRPAPERMASMERPVVRTAPALEPRLVEAPKQVAAVRPTALMPSASDRARLAELANLASVTPTQVALPQLARRPERPSQPSLTGTSLPLPPSALPQMAKPAAPERQVASLGPSALPSGNLADIGGRFGWGAWVPAPAYDEEHPEELSYRPFPITPYLTETATQPLMNEMVPHDVARTVDVLDQPDATTVMRFRPTGQAAGLLWAQQFTGAAIAMDKLREAQAEADLPRASGLRSRAVKTSQR